MKKLPLHFLAVLCACLAPVLAYAQLTVAPFLTSNPQFSDNNGAPLNAGCVFSYAAGTSNPQATFTDSTGTVQNANPIITTSAGYATSGGIWLSSSAYKFVGKTSGGVNCATGTQLWSIDNITWSTPFSTFNGITDAGVFNITQPTAATSGANQSSFTDCIHGTYWTGAASADDKWCWQDVLGTGSNPTTTYTLTHTGSPGAAAVSLGSLALTGQSLNGDLWVGNGTGQYASIAACYAALVAGQACHVSANWTDPTWTANLVMNKNNTGFIFHGAATMPMSTFQVVISTGTIGAFIKALPAATNRSSGAGTAVTFNYTGTSDVFAVGSAGTGTPYTDFQNFNINAGSGANTVALHIVQSNNGSYTNIGGGGTGTGAVGLLLDGNAACTCDNNFYNTGFGAGASGSALRLKNSANLNHFYGGSVTATAAGSIGIDLQGVNGNTFDMDDETNVTAVSATGTNTTKNIIRVYLGGNTTDYSFNASSSNNVLENLSGTTFTPNGTDSGTNNRITIGPQPGVINHQGQTGTLTGNSSDQVVYTFTLPAGVLTAGKCLRVKYHWLHSLQTNTVNYLIKFGSTSVFGGANGLQSGGVDNSSIEYFWVDMCNNSGVQNAQDINVERCLRTAAVANIPGCNSAAPGHTSSAIDFTAQQIITATFNVANTDQIIGTGFWVELL